MLDEERTVKNTRNRFGEMVPLSKETCEFIMQFCFECMSEAELNQAFKKPHYKQSAFEF